MLHLHPAPFHPLFWFGSIAFDSHIIHAGLSHPPEPAGSEYKAQIAFGHKVYTADCKKLEKSTARESARTSMNHPYMHA